MPCRSTHTQQKEFEKKRGKSIEKKETIQEHGYKISQKIYLYIYRKPFSETDSKMVSIARRQLNTLVWLVSKMASVDLTMSYRKTCFSSPVGVKVGPFRFHMESRNAFKWDARYSLEFKNRSSRAETKGGEGSNGLYGDGWM